MLFARSLRTAALVARQTPAFAAMRVAAPAWTFAGRSFATKGLTLEKVQDRVLNVVKNFEKVEPAKVTLDAHFVQDLGLDSLDQVDLTMAIEEEFSIEIEDSEAEKIMTARQAADTVGTILLG
ncbi:hypothetical protein HDU96_003918 [Phlyctochytrium bullatum]|nr:hypothetical protein HDU96_003918 [Phlyctochytrium bullatum]